MAKRRTVHDSPIWQCAACMRQFTGGPRCAEHNPTPEQREAEPDRYLRDRFVKHYRDGRT